jgi:hypothetical protein
VSECKYRKRERDNTHTNTHELTHTHARTHAHASLGRAAADLFAVCAAGFRCSMRRDMTKLRVPLCKAEVGRFSAQWRLALVVPLYFIISFITVLTLLWSGRRHKKSTYLPNTVSTIYVDMCPHATLQYQIRASVSRDTSPAASRRVFMCVCVCVCVCIHIHTYIHTYINIYICIYMHTCIYTYIHTYIYI